MNNTLWTMRSRFGAAPLPKLFAAMLKLLFAVLFLPLLHAESGLEPSYNGKSLSYWLDDYDKESSQRYFVLFGQFAPLTTEQTNAVLFMGADAVPWLVKRISIPDQLSERGTIQAFGVLGPLACSAIPDLVQLVTNHPEEFASGNGVRFIAPYCPILALGRIGADALPALLEILTNSLSPGRRLRALEAIAGIGTNALPALPVLMRYVNDANDLVARESVKTIGAVGARQPAGVHALEQVMQASNLPERQIRSEALSAFRYFGEDCAPAVIPALDDKDNYFIAFTTLVAAAPHALTNATVLRSAATGLQSPDFDRQDGAAQMLRAAGQQACGQRPDYEVSGGDMKAIYREATNALRSLSPELYNEHIAAHVPFHTSTAR